MRTERCLLLLMLLTLSPATTAGTLVDGSVWLDRDADGRRGAGEPGVPGVKLSNGREIATTDAEGRYRIALADGDTLFVIKPAGHALPQRSDGMPDFWRHHFPHGSPPLRFGGIAAQQAGTDFALLEASASDDALEVLVFGDPQPRSEAEVGYYARDIVEPLVGRHSARLGLTLGDVVDDVLSLYPAMNAITRRLGVPWLHAPGNHDLDFDAAGDHASLLTYRATFGPDTYAWEEAAANFLVFDDVIYQPGQSPAYVGGLRDDQLQFIEAWLATLDPARPLVLAAHIPLFDAPSPSSFRRDDRRRLFALLQRFERVLVLTSHSHAQQHRFHDASSDWHGTGPLHEYNVGATCGGFWGGVLDGDGIPDAGMADGTPNGHARLRIDMHGDYHLAWHPARADDDQQIALHAPRVLRHGSYPGVSVWANVFMGTADSRVEYRIDDGEWQPMQRSVTADPRVQAENIADDLAEVLRGPKRMPQATPSPHLWRGTLPTTLAPGEHRIEVRAFDRWRGETVARTHYRLDP